MDTQNHFYGHAAVLARYAGLGQQRHIPGLLQHGWTRLSPVHGNFQDFPDIGRGMTGRRLFVWSHESRGWSPQREDRTTTAIGAPFLYLLRLTGPRPEPTHRVLILPLHGSTLLEVSGDHRHLAEYYRETEGPATVCLHVEDLSKPALVDAWALPGNTLVSAGSRYDQRFLGRLLRLFTTHERIVSNRLATGLLYAGSLGREVSIHGDPMDIGAAEDLTIEEMSQAWPEFYGVNTRTTATTEVSRAELGWAFVRAPDELRHELGWDRHRPGPFLDYWAMGPLRKTGHVLGIGERAEGSTDRQQGLRLRDYLRSPFTHLPRPLGRLDPAVGSPNEPLFL